MLLDSVVAQRRISWDFPGLEALRRWSEVQAIGSRGGVALVVLPRFGETEHLRRATQMTVASHLDPLDLAVRYVDEEDGDLVDTEPPLVQRLGLSVGWDRSGGIHRLREMLARTVRAQRRVFAATCTSCSDLDEAQRLVEWGGKLQDPAVFSILLFTSQEVYAGTDGDVVVDLRTGSLNGSRCNFWTEDRTRDAWRLFMLQKVAWEVAGCPSRFSAMEVAVTAALHQEQSDEWLESILTNTGATWLMPPDEDVKILVGLYSSDNTFSASAQDIDDRCRALARAGLLWRPHFSMAWLITPWHARRLFRCFDQNRAPWILRRSLYCAPIASEIAMKCTQLELLLRERLIPEIGTCMVEGARESLVRFSSRGLAQRHLVYATANPGAPTHSRPSDSWLFADLGDLIHAFRTKPGRSQKLLESMEELARVRNAVSHCHPPAWTHVAFLRALSAQLESG